MAGKIPLEPKDFKKAPQARVSIVASMWHKEIIEVMIASAKQHLLDLGLSENNINVVWAPGSHEIPLYAKLLLEADSELDGILAFGVVLRGGTTHNDSVLQAAVNSFTGLSLAYSKPIINEVIGVNDIKEAEERAESKGAEAVFAFSEVFNFQKSLSKLNKNVGF